MRLVSLLAILVLLPVAYADTSIAVAQVRLTIVNDPPALLSLHLSPQTAYDDSMIECMGEVKDERPFSVRYEYRWYLNGEYAGSRQPELRAGDKVTCEAVPIDDPLNERDVRGGRGLRWTQKRPSA